MMMKFLGYAMVLLLGACAVNKTPLSPHGQLNVCLRDEVNNMKNDGRLETLGKAAVAQKAARHCLDELNMKDAFSQNMAYRNADFLLSGSDGISLK